MQLKFGKLFIFSFIFLCSSYTFSQSFSFIAFGDWGREGMFGQKETAVAMGRYAEKNKTKFVLTLGDNIYESGVKSVSDPLWKLSFEDIYTASSLQNRWYITLGNHDYGGSVQAQIDYSKVSKRWYLPSRYYSFEEKIDGITNALFVIIDTSPFIKSYRTPNIYDDELNDSSIIQLSYQALNVQLKWLDNILANSTAKWKIVSGHHPIYSGGSHGNTDELIEQVAPILEKHRVTMYLAGHDHDMQHIRLPGSSVNYFVSGTGSRLRAVFGTENSLFFESQNGFLNVKISRSKITARFIGLEGNSLYKTIIK